jgi:membrane protease YdiL (CAAX protease family)
MKININWKLFFLLLFTCIFVSLLVMPYTIALSPKLIEIFTPKIIIIQVVQNIILFFIAIFIGLNLSKSIGFKLPILEGVVEKKYQTAYLKSILLSSVGFGVLGGILVIILSLPFWRLSVELLKAEITAAAWKGFLASFYGGFAEETIFRLFFVSLFVWITWKIKKAKDGTPAKIGIWLSIIITSIIFGLGHLGITGELTDITAEVTARAVLLNSAVSVIYGWLYWKKGLESAMIAHFSTDIVLHVITPLIASIFIGVM